MMIGTFISFAMNVHLIPDGLDILPAHFTVSTSEGIVFSPSPHVLSLSLARLYGLFPYHP